MIHHDRVIAEFYRDITFFTFTKYLLYLVL